MDQFFTELGREVLARWKAINFSLEAFPGLAQKVLEEQPPAEVVDVQELIQEFLLNDEQPFQTQSNFGQPELVVYDDPRFYIQVLFWLEGTTDIHQHMFSGAFHVLQGSSIHSEFELEDAQSISAHLRVGQLKMKRTELLETGRTVPIISGNSYVHALFHLETPSLTVVIRTHTDPGSGPQFTYLPPHLAVDPFHHDALTARRKELLDVLERLEDPSYPEIVLEMIGTLDFERGFFILQNCMGYLLSLDCWDEVWEAFESKHGALAEYVRATLDEIVWRDGPLGLRSSVTDVEHRFFLALLLNVPHRLDFLALVSRRFPGEEIPTVVRWCEELSNTSEVGTWILDAEFPAELDYSGQVQAQVFFASLRYFLEGEKDAEPLAFYGIEQEGLELLRAAFARSSLRTLVS